MLSREKMILVSDCALEGFCWVATLHWKCHDLLGVVCDFFEDWDQLRGFMRRDFDSVSLSVRLTSVMIDLMGLENYLELWYFGAWQSFGMVCSKHRGHSFVGIVFGIKACNKSNLL
jgi:hypothetical protein